MDVQKLIIQKCFTYYSTYKVEIPVAIRIDIRVRWWCVSIAMSSWDKKSIVRIEYFHWKLLEPFSGQPSSVESLLVLISDLKLGSHFWTRFIDDLSKWVIKELLSSDFKLNLMIRILQLSKLVIEFLSFDIKIDQVCS